MLHSNCHGHPTFDPRDIPHYMLHIKCQGHRFVGSGEEDFKGFHRK